MPQVSCAVMVAGDLRVSIEEMPLKKKKTEDDRRVSTESLC